MGRGPRPSEVPPSACAGRASEEIHQHGGSTDVLEAAPTDDCSRAHGRRLTGWEEVSLAWTLECCELRGTFDDTHQA